MISQKNHRHRQALDITRPIPPLSKICYHKPRSKKKESRYCAIKIKRNIYDVLTEAACLSILAALVAYIIISWGNLPEQVPMHYNLQGQVDSMGGKSEVIVMPIIAVFIYLLLTIVGRIPQMWNTGVKVTEENRERVFRILKNLLNTLNLLLILFFAYLTLVFALPMKFNTMSVPVFLILMFGSLGFFIVKLVKAR